MHPSHAHWAGCQHWQPPCRVATAPSTSHDMPVRSAAALAHPDAVATAMWQTLKLTNMAQVQLGHMSLSRIVGNPNQCCAAGF